MIVKSLKLRDVRNLAPLQLTPGPRFNVFSGDNGQGKTNLLEALYALCTLRSFRAGRLAEMIALGAQEAQLGAVVERESLERHYQLTIRPRGRSIRLDGKVVRPVSRYFGDFNVVLFAPEDLQVPRGSPGERRRFLDRAVFNHDRGFLPLAQAYDKALRSRNRLLRDAEPGRRPPGELLAVYDRQVAELGARLQRARHRYLELLEPRFASAFEEITRSGLGGGLEYHSSFPLPPESSHGEEALADRLLEEIQATTARDLARGSTSVGPHRDELRFTLAGQPAATFASQGQLRALVLAWKTAEMNILSGVRDSAPILLLDDVSSELDDTRNRYLFDFLLQRVNQCFITTTAARHVLVRDDRVDFSVSEGRVERVGQGPCN